MVANSLPEEQGIARETIRLDIHPEKRNARGNVEESGRGLPSGIKIHTPTKIDLMKRSILFLIRGYRSVISPVLGQHCRFHPTCSVYTYEAIEKHGLLKGMILGTKRLLRCHPFHPRGVDPVP